ncbi:6848_t:CDS:10, partial [Paraglomus brasilianum]
PGEHKMNLILSASGTDGRNGRDGRNGSMGESKGDDGEDGGNATEPTKGNDGGGINSLIKFVSYFLRFKITSDTTTGLSVEFSGRYREVKHKFEEFNKTYICDIDSCFKLEARGGNGGIGGDGGDGGDGAWGTKGRNASEHYPATDGGQGGDGGDAGAGTSGGNGGNGGEITLRMLDTDAGLLMMFVETWIPKIVYSLDVSGGAGGIAGQHGVPGIGGEGGKGGSSYSWRETREHYDNNGQLVTTSINHHRNGGHDGTPGASGRRPNYHLHDGKPGNDGTIRFVIQDSVTKGSLVYDEIFNIHLEQVNVHSATGVFEPEAEIHIDSLTVHNESTMPTPRRDIRITIEDSVWILNKKEMDFTTLPHLIGPNAYKEIDCKKPFSFIIRKHAVDEPGPPFRASDELCLKANMTGLGKEFPTFNNRSHIINIQYPIEFTRVSHMNSMITGIETKVIWGVTNTSEVDFGTRSENGRCVRVRIRKKYGEISPSAIRFGLNPEQQGVGNISPAQTLDKEFIFEIPLLRAGQTLHLEANLVISEAELYEYAEFWLYLELGKVLTPSASNVVHIQSFNVRMSNVYSGFPPGFYPDILIVTNHKTTRNEYVAWDTLLRQRLGLRFFLWDISLMGHFSLTKRISTSFSKESTTTLMKDHVGKTFIILNNEFEYVYGDESRMVTALDFMVKQEWLKAIHENDNKFYVVYFNTTVSDCVSTLNDLRKTPYKARKPIKYKFERVRHFMTHLGIKQTESLRDKDKDDEEDSSESTKTLSQKDIVDDRESIHNTNPSILIKEIVKVQIQAKLFCNMERRIKKKAAKVDNRLKKSRPNIQHLIIYKWHDAKKPLFRTKKNIYVKTGGRVKVLPSLTTTKQRIIFATAAEDVDPAIFTNTPVNLRGVIASLGIDTLFHLLGQIFVTRFNTDTDSVRSFPTSDHRTLDSREQQIAEIIKQKIVYDVAVELSTVCDGIGDNYSLEDEQVLEMMENLRRLVWKVEALSKTTKQEVTLATISEECENTSSPAHPEEPDQAQVDQNDDNEVIAEIDQADNYNEVISETPPIYDDAIKNDVQSTTAYSESREEMEAFDMFPVKQGTPLGEWILDILAQLYAFVESLRAGIHQSILPNRRAVKIHQQSMDLLHRIGDATIIGFADPRFSTESLYMQGSTKTRRIDVVLPTQSIVDDEKEKSSTVVISDTCSNYSDDSRNYISNQEQRSSRLSRQPSLMSLVSDIWSPSVRRAAKMSLLSSSSNDMSMPCSYIPYKRLDVKRQKLIKSFKTGIKVRLRKMIQKYYTQWERDANYNLGGVLDPLKRDLRRCAREAIFAHFASLVDNTIYGGNPKKIKDGHISGVKNTIISRSEFAKQRNLEIDRVNNMENVISTFFAFRNMMMEEPVKRSPI